MLSGEGRHGIEDCQGRVKCTKVGFVTGNKAAFLHGIRPDENICDWTFGGTSGTLAYDMLVPRLVGEKNGLLATPEIALNPHCVQKRILRSDIAARIRRSTSSSFDCNAMDDTSENVLSPRNTSIKTHVSTTQIILLLPLEVHALRLPSSDTLDEIFCRIQ